VRIGWLESESLSHLCRQYECDDECVHQSGFGEPGERSEPRGLSRAAMLSSVRGFTSGVAVGGDEEVTGQEGQNADGVC